MIWEGCRTGNDHCDRHLFAHQNALEDGDLTRYAAALDLATHAYEALIDGDLRGGIRSGVQGTPTLFINGVRHDTSWEHHILLPALQHAKAVIARSGSAAGEDSSVQ